MEEKTTLAEFEETLEKLSQEDSTKDIFAILGMPEDQFMILAPTVIDKFRKSLNNINDRLLLIQALNASGTKMEDLQDAFAAVMDEISSMEDFSESKKDFLREVMSALLNAMSETEGIAKRIIKIPVCKIHENARLPEYAHTGDSGMDIFSLDDYIIHPGETKLIPTGIKAALPPGYEFQIRPKSGRSLKTKMRIANTPSTIDDCYRGEIGIIIENIEAPIQDITYHEEDGHLVIDSILHGRDFSIGKGEKFAQLVLAEVPKASWVEVAEIKEDTDRGAGGYGSSGLK